MNTLHHIDCARSNYNDTLELQRRYFEAVIGGGRGVVIFVEHNHVYTLGKSGHQNNLLVNEQFLSQIGATYVKTDRGGDITYHGPGQIVIYPIVNLTELGISLRDYIFKLEQTIIDTVATYGIAGGRIDGATGVWIEGQRKIAAIGVKASRGVTMHGAALNVNTDLSYFSHINPCGFVDKGVTSIENEGVSVNMDEVKSELLKNFTKNFGVSIDL